MERPLEANHRAERQRARYPPDDYEVVVIYAL